MTKPIEDDDCESDDDDLDNSAAMQSPKIDQHYGNNDEPAKYNSELLTNRGNWKHPLSNSLFNAFNEYIKN